MACTRRGKKRLELYYARVPPPVILFNMKTIYTSYFANARNLPPDIPQISIARGTPRSWKGLRHERLLKPIAEVFQLGKANPSGRAWKLAYDKQIAPVIASVHAELPERCVLLCWETDWGDCHRRIAWLALQSQCGVEGGEFPIQQAGEPSLF